MRIEAAIREDAAVIVVADDDDDNDAAAIVVSDYYLRPMPISPNVCVAVVKALESVEERDRQ